MIRRLRDRRIGQRGFTLIELLIVVAIIGIIAMILIPNLLDALQKAKQKRTVADMKLIGIGWMAWLTDQVAGAAAGQSTAGVLDWSTLVEHSYEELYEDLVPVYMKDLPRHDGWRFEYDFGLATSLEAPLPIALRARGNDNAFDGESYVQGPFVTTDYAQDIVWSGGFFIRWPGGLE